ncbi:MAG TPA: SUKH-4 family immunity protein [Methylomirabilota bacterium]|jgi:hypothetical protein|nr:SUKH-4 family immunity protein [Methylomirabilota bacterium]
MISPQIHSKLANYWKNESVLCLKASIGGALSGTDLAELWELVGMPSQDWWLFRFVVPSNQMAGSDVVFGTVGINWNLHYRLAEDICFATDENGIERFANSSFVSFMEMLVLFDEGYRKIQRECAGDSGTDWDRGDVIIQEMKTSMRLIDQRAFEKDSNLWPYLLIDING